MGLPDNASAEDNRFNENYFGVARMRAGIPVERANALMGVLVNRVQGDPGNGRFAKSSGWGMFVVPLADFSTGDTKTPVIVLLISVGFVLLIACSNIAGLMLARNSERSREIAVRRALGAGLRGAVGRCSGGRRAGLPGSPSPAAPAPQGRAVAVGDASGTRACRCRRGGGRARDLTRATRGASRTRWRRRRRPAG